MTYIVCMVTTCHVMVGALCRGLMLLLTLISLYGPAATAQDKDLLVIPTLRVALRDMPGLISQQQPGPYNTIYRRAMKNSPVVVLDQFLPTRRAMAYFIQDKVDCLFVSGALKVFKTPTSDPIAITASEPIQTVNLHVYVPRDREPPHSLADLAGKTLVVEQGSMAQVINLRLGALGANIISVQSMVQAVDLLGKRAEAALAVFDFDLSLQRRLGRGHDLHHDPAFVLAQSKDALVCRQGDLEQALIDHFSAHLAVLRQSGGLQKILGMAAGNSSGNSSRD